MKEAVRTNHNITIDTFSPWSIPLARIKTYKNIPLTIHMMAVYSHLLGWKQTTGIIRPSQSYIAESCLIGLSTVQKAVKKLTEMGWITMKSVRKGGSKEVLYTEYTVKTPADIIEENNAFIKASGGVSGVVPIKKAKAKTKSGEKNVKAEQEDKPHTGNTEPSQELSEQHTDQHSTDAPDKLARAPESLPDAITSGIRQSPERCLDYGDMAYPDYWVDISPGTLNDETEHQQDYTDYSDYINWCDGDKGSFALPPLEMCGL